MPLALVATVCAGLFAGAAIYITLVEHPARLSCGTALAVREFGPSYLRATLMQAPLAFFGTFPALDPESEKALHLLHRWGRLHAVRTVLSAAAFVVLLLNVASD